MEFNKEEAIRAKDIAVKKMQNRDFTGALKVAARAQQLFQDLENVSQMIMVCEVHCASEKRLYGNEMDWYAILKVEETADEATIKKQYRKFALQLHPDKNKFPGAEAAFQLIGEAQRILLDKGKRATHDMKRKVTVNRVAPAAACRPPQKPSWYQHSAVPNNFHGRFPGVNLQQQAQQQQKQPTQTGFPNGRTTFWTKCPFCTVRYQYYTEVLNRTLRCQTCDKSFVAYNSGADPQASNMSQQNFPQQRHVPNPGVCKVNLQSQGNVTAENAKSAFSPNVARSSEVGTDKVNRKRRRKQTVESSDESCDSESSSESEEDIEVDDIGDVSARKNFDSQREQNLRRSGRRKQHVSYKENLSDEEDMVDPTKKAEGSGTPFANVEKEEVPKEDKSKLNNQSGLDCEVQEDKKAMEHKAGTSSGVSLLNGQKESRKGFGKETAKEDNLKKTRDGDSVSDSSLKDTEEPLVFSCPEPEFNDFEKNKKDECFKLGQIWAVYDTLDAMPRFYARIKKVFSPGFKLRITWLEPDPDDEEEKEWVSEGLPASCGKFKNGYSEINEDRDMFSHLIYWERGPSTDTCKIFPRKGETWALFKNWNIKLKSDLKYEYEYAVVLSEYSEGFGIHVAYLTKVEGFVSVFHQTSKTGVDTVLIPPNELFRFSHRIPSFVLTGEEREGVPKGSFELDPASLPAQPEQIVTPKDLKVDGDHRDSNSSCSSSKKVAPVEGSEKSAPPSSLENLEIPEPQFYNFDADKSPEKFSVGQVWALYSDEDGLPRYYGEIKRIQSKPVFEIHLRWLDACPSQSTNLNLWYDKGMNHGCGRFRIKRGSSQSYSSTITFSHKLTVEPAGRKDEYDILPRKGEIWALYRNWSLGIKPSDLGTWKYDIVQVMEETVEHFKVLVLERVPGLHSVFKPKGKGRSNVTMEILRVDQLRFSHQIPYFQLNEERNGSLRGFWELDPLAVPVHFFSS